MTMTLTDFDAARAAMIDSQLRPSDVNDAAILAAFHRVAREDFVPAALADCAYIDRALPLGDGRALNPPLTTARLLTALGPIAGKNILLIGAATGYAAALLEELGARLVAVEAAAGLYARLKAVAGIIAVHGALEGGAPGHGPFDAIIIDGAIEQLPAALADQLADGGRIVTGLAKGPLTQLARGVKAGGTVALVPYADMECVPLPGFAIARQFRF